MTHSDHKRRKKKCFHCQKCKKTDHRTGSNEENMVANHRIMESLKPKTDEKYTKIMGEIQAVILSSAIYLRF